MPASDPQQKRLYDAEETFTYHRARLKRKDIHKIMRRVCRLYGVPVPKLKFFREKRSWVGAYMRYCAPGTDPMIEINSVHVFSTMGLLHELAHWIDVRCFGYSDRDDHGPKFCGIMMWLYDYFEVIPAYAFEVILKRHKCRFLPASRCSPARLKKKAR